MKPGPKLGQARTRIRDLWYEAGCPTSREEGLRLCKRIVVEIRSAALIACSARSS